MKEMTLDENGLPVGYLFHEDFEMSPRVAARELCTRDDFLIIDCRTPEEWEVCRVEGSVLIPLHELESRLDEIEDALSERGMSDELPIGVICHHGNRSVKAALLLQRHGFAGAKSVVGGIDLWAMDVQPGMPRYERENGVCRVVRA